MSCMRELTIFVYMYVSGIRCIEERFLEHAQNFQRIFKRGKVSSFIYKKKKYIKKKEKSKEKERKGL